MALVCTGMRMWVLEASRVSWQEDRQGVGGGGGKVCRFNFAEFRSRSFSFVPATVLLHLPFVYFKVRKRGERMVGETHIFFSLRVLLYSPQLPHERHFCLAVKYIALHLLLMRFALLFFHFVGKRLIFRPDSQILFPQG